MNDIYSYWVYIVNAWENIDEIKRLAKSKTSISTDDTATLHPSQAQDENLLPKFFF